MASSIIHPLRLFAVHPSSDPAAKKKNASDVEKIKRLLSLQFADGKKNEPLVLSRQAHRAVTALGRGS